MAIPMDENQGIPKMKTRRRHTRKKSGNGTKKRQWIYILFHFPVLGIICKIGITGNKDERILGISKSLPGFVFPVFAIKVRNAYGVEQFIKHGFYGFLGVPFIGSGKTEWYMCIVIPFALLIILVWWALPIIYLIILAAVVLLSTNEHAIKKIYPWARSVVHKLRGSDIRSADQAIEFENSGIRRNTSVDRTELPIGPDDRNN